MFLLPPFLCILYIFALNSSILIHRILMLPAVARQSHNHPRVLQNIVGNHENRPAAAIFAKRMLTANAAVRPSLLMLSQ